MNLWRKVWLSVFILTGIIFSAEGQEASVIRQADSVLRARGEIYLTFEPQYLSPKLASILSIERISDNLVYAYANREGFSQIINLNFPFLLRPENFLVSGLKNAAVSDPDSVYPSYPEYLKMMQDFATQFPDWCGLYEIGTSIQGRKILALKLSSPVNSSESRPAIMLSGTIHGNELTGYKLLLQLTDELLKNYESDPLINKLLNNCVVWINPLANPDGTFFGGDNTVVAAKRFNAKNTDLNRNFPDLLEGNHPDGKSWQPETIAMMDFYKNHGINLSANLHTGEVVVNYPWDTWSRLHADNEWFKAISRQYADTAQKMSNNRYMNSTANGFDRGIVNGFQWYRITGGRQDYFTYFAGGREVTLELSNENMPGLAEVSRYWDYNRLSLLRFIEQSLFGVKGKITDAETNLPLKARIEIINYDKDNSQVYSDKSSGYFYRYPAPGTYHFLISAPGFLPKIVEDVVVENRTQTILDVSLQRVGKTFVSPNPFRDYLDIVLDSANNSDRISIRIVSLTGKIILEKEMQAGLNYPVRLSVEDFAPGLYLLEVKTGTTTKIFKIVKH